MSDEYFCFDVTLIATVYVHDATSMDQARQMLDNYQVVEHFPTDDVADEQGTCGRVELREASLNTVLEAVYHHGADGTLADVPAAPGDGAAIYAGTHGRKLAAALDAFRAADTSGSPEAPAAARALAATAAALLLTEHHTAPTPSPAG